ncbi:MAG: hypothetical protein QOJ89_2600 [bacterium]|jgi:hypothetical protein
MALIQNVEPDLAALAGYIVARARERRVTLNRLRLVKLLYLVDVENVRTRRTPVTGVQWVFADFGPHCDELDAMLAELERATALYRTLQEDAPDGEEWISGTRRTVDSVVERFAALPPNVLLDHVYFHTGPMRGARRGELLDLDRARDDTGPRRALPLRPVAPPALDVETTIVPPGTAQSWLRSETAAAVPDEVGARLCTWRASTKRRFLPLRLDPPAGLLGDPEQAALAGRVRGKLHARHEREL